MSEVKTLATLCLGGMFDHSELGDIDIHYSMGNVEELQERLVTGIDDVHVELVSRIDYDALQSELSALREELATLRESYESMRDRKNSIVDLQQRLTAAEQRNLSLLETARSLTIQLHATFGNTELHEDCIRDLSALETGNAKD